MKNDEIKKIVKEGYGKIAKSGSGCGCSCNCGSAGNEQVARSIGYSEKEIKAVPDANIGLGCGNPTALGGIKEGMTVLDLGSGAGFDCFLAAKKAGNKGKVIGVDMTGAMVEKARRNAKKYGYSNVEFRLGEIEKLPVEGKSVDVVISNCAINLSPDKQKVFSEAYRVLKKGGRMFISDIVLLEKLTDAQRKDEELLVGCVGGALLKEKYLQLIRNSGFSVKIHSKDRGISERQYGGLPIESLKIVAVK